MSDPGKPGNLCEGLEAGPRNGAGRLGSADDDGRVVEPDALGEVIREECGVDGTAALDQDPGDWQASQFSHHPGKIYPTHPFRCDPDLNLVAQLSHSVRVCGFPHHNPGPGVKGVVEKGGLERGSTLGVEHDAPGRMLPVSKADRQPRIIGQDGTDADDDGVVVVAEAHDIESGTGVGDPAGFTGACCDLAVEGEAGLERDEGGAMTDPVIEPDIEFGGGIGEEPGVDLDTGLAEEMEAATGVGGIGIGGGHHDPFDVGGDNGVGAGRGASVGAARFQGDVERGPAQVVTLGLGIADGLDLGMGHSGPMMPAVAELKAVSNQHGPDHGIRTGPAPTAACQCQGPSHPVEILDRIHSTIRHRPGWMGLRRGWGIGHRIGMDMGATLGANLWRAGG